MEVKVITVLCNNETVVGAVLGHGPALALLVEEGTEALSRTDLVTARFGSRWPV